MIYFVSADHCDGGIQNFLVEADDAEEAAASVSASTFGLTIIDSVIMDTVVPIESYWPPGSVPPGKLNRFYKEAKDRNHDHQ